MPASVPLSCDEKSRLACWRYTLEGHAAAVRAVEHFERRSNGDGSLQSAEPETEACCPCCGAPLDPDLDECASCRRDFHSPPSTWRLLRLWRFATPYKLQLCFGFALTLTATAGLGAADLTMPLMDKVLVPFERGEPIDFGFAGLVPVGAGLGSPSSRGCWAGRGPTSWRW